MGEVRQPWYQECMEEFFQRLHLHAFSEDLLGTIKTIFVEVLENVASKGKLDEEKDLSGTTLIRCRSCDTSILPRALRVHLRTFHSEDFQDVSSSSDVEAEADESPVPSKPPKTTVCSICEEEVPTRNLKQHQKKYHKNRRSVATPDVCPHCGKVYKQKVRMQRHLTECGPNRPPPVPEPEVPVHSRTCSVCGKEFKSIDSLRFHEKTLHQPPKFKCEYCGKMFRVRQKLLNHHQTHTGERAFQCDKCPRAFIRKTQLTDHMNVHEGLKPYACHMCPASFPHRGSLHMHMKHMHQEKTEQCPQCPKMFSTRQALKMHVSTHSASWDVKVACDICGKQVREPRLEAHVRKMHGRDVQEKCELCDRSVPADRLFLHVSDAHGPKPNVDCTICGKRFAFTSALKNHEAVHQETTANVAKNHKPLIPPVPQSSQTAAAAAPEPTKYSSELLAAQKYEMPEDHNLGAKFQPDPNTAESAAARFLAPFSTAPEQARFHHNFADASAAAFALPTLEVRPFVCPICGESFAFDAARYNHMRMKHR